MSDRSEMLGNYLKDNATTLSPVAWKMARTQFQMMSSEERRQTWSIASAAANSTKDASLAFATRCLCYIHLCDLVLDTFRVVPGNAAT
jgi:hypothetical protein